MLDTSPLVDVQDFDRCSSDGRAAGKDRTIPQEVIRPGVIARVEQRNQGIGVRIKARSIAALGPVAVGAREAGVLQRRRAAMLSGTDMIDLVSKETEPLRNMAVFAPVLGTLPHQLAVDSCHWSTF